MIEPNKKNLHAEILQRYSVDTDNLINLKGPWDLGYAISLHSVSSIPIDPDHYHYKTKYTPMGGLLHKYKYMDKFSLKEDLINVAIAIIEVKFYELSIDVLAIPPSNAKRVNYQPMEEIAKGLSSNLGIEFCKFFTQKEIGNTMKNIKVKDDKKKYLVENLCCSINNIGNKNIFIIDDIFDSGATLEICTQKLKEKKCRNIYVLTFTKTR